LSSLNFVEKIHVRTSPALVAYYLIICPVSEKYTKPT
jgi:hypothetical protein